MYLEVVATTVQVQTSQMKPTAIFAQVNLEYKVIFWVQAVCNLCQPILQFGSINSVRSSFAQVGFQATA